MSTLYTVGYETPPQRAGATATALGVLIEKLKENNVEALCDIRLHPSSRISGLSKTALAASLEQVGITYQHFPALGNPKENRPGYAKVSTRGAAQETFRAILATTPESLLALHEVAEIAVAQPTALLCYEADAERCHRSDVAQALADGVGLTIIHLS